jgi:hypothetical protein
VLAALRAAAEPDELELNQLLDDLDHTVSALERAAAESASAVSGESRLDRSGT